MGFPSFPVDNSGLWITPACGADRDRIAISGMAPAVDSLHDSPPR
jgi:hypothetical protein